MRDNSAPIQGITVPIFVEISSLFSGESGVALLEQAEPIRFQESATIWRCLIRNIPEETPPDFHHIVAGIGSEFSFNLVQNHLKNANLWSYLEKILPR